MTDDEPIAVIGTRRAMRELADGTLRVQIDIDQRYRDVFLKYFSQIDVAVALCPVKAGPEGIE